MKNIILRALVSAAPDEFDISDEPKRAKIKFREKLMLAIFPTVLTTSKQFSNRLMKERNSKRKLNQNT